jgi:small redox-active disulfide protein 2
MKLQILGTGCAKCKALTQNVQMAVDQMGIDATIEKVEDLPSIMKFGVMSTPCLVVDGKVALSGRVASPDEISRLLSEAK